MKQNKIDFHGGNIYKIHRENKLSQIIDYSSNINPYGIPKGLKEKIIKNLEVLERYPDPDYIELREKIAFINGLKLENIIVGNGATEIIFLYMKALGAKKILIVSPTFGEYERAMRATLENVEIHYFKLEEKEEFVLNFEKLEKELENKYDLLVVCNPNNPTGKFIKLDLMEKILNICNNFDTKLFVDEAFVEFVENWKIENMTKTKIDKRNLFILRAFTKFFAIPGLRLGYGIVFDIDLFNNMIEKKEPWSVNNIADLTGKIVLDDNEYINKTNEWIKKEKTYMYDELKKIEGIFPFKTEVNFILIKICENSVKKGLNASRLKTEMLKNQILIRDASNFVYLNEEYFRIAIKDRKNNDIVLNNLKEILKKFI